MPNRTEFSRTEDAHQNNASEKKRNFLQRVFGSRKTEAETREKPEKGRPSMNDIKKTIDKLGITPEQIKKTREMLKKLHYPVSTDSSAYDENLQQALIQFQDKIGPSHPSILDVAVTKDGVTTLVENGYVQQASYGILGRGLYSVLSEMAETKGGLDELRQELIQTAVDKNTSLAASISAEEQGKIYENLGVSPSTGFGSRAFVDIVQRFQRDNGLEADGWIAKDGPTWQKIFQTTSETPPVPGETPQVKKEDDAQKPAEAPQKPPVRTETPGETPQPPKTPDKVHEAEENEKKILTELHKLDGFQKATLADIGLSQYDYHLPESSPLKWHDEDAQNDWGLVMGDGFTVKNGKIYTPDGHEVSQKGEEIKKDTPSEGNDKWKDLSPEFRKLVENKDGKIPEPINIQEINDNAASSSHKTPIQQLGDADIRYIQACTSIRRILFNGDAKGLQKIDFSKLTHLNIVSANISAPGINIGKNSGNNIRVVTGDKYQKIDFDSEKSYIYQNRKLTEGGALSDAEQVGSEDLEVIAVGMKILESLRANPALKDIKTLKEIGITYLDSKGWQFPPGIVWSDLSHDGSHSVKIVPGYKVEKGKIVPQITPGPSKPLENNEKWATLSVDFKKLVTDNQGNILEPSKVTKIKAEGSTPTSLSSKDTEYINLCTSLNEIHLDHVENLNGIKFENFTSIILRATGLTEEFDVPSSVKSVFSEGKYVGVDSDKIYIYTQGKLELREVHERAKIVTELQKLPGLEKATPEQVGIIYNGEGGWVVPKGLEWADSESGSFKLKFSAGFRAENGVIIPPSVAEKPKDTLRSNDSVELREFDGYNVLYEKGDPEAVKKMDVLTELYNKNKDRFDAIKKSYGKPLTILLVGEKNWKNVIEDGLKGNRDDTGHPVYDSQFVGAWNYFDISPTLKAHFGQGNISGLYPGIIFRSEEQSDKFDNTFSNEFFESYASSLFQNVNPEKHDKEPWEETAPLQVAGWYIDYYFEKNTNGIRISDLVKLMNSDGITVSDNKTIGDFYREGDKKQKIVSDLYSSRANIPANVLSVMTTVLRQKILTYAPTLKIEIDKINFTFDSDSHLLRATYVDSFQTRGAVTKSADISQKSPLDSSSPLARRIPGFTLSK